MSSPRFICTGCKVCCHKLGDTCVSWGGAVASEPAAEVMPEVDDARRGAAPDVAAGAAVPAASTYKSARRFARLSAMHAMPHVAFAPALPQVGSTRSCMQCLCVHDVRGLQARRLHPILHAAIHFPDISSGCQEVSYLCPGGRSTRFAADSDLAVNYQGN